MGQSHTAHPHSHPHNESSAGEAGPTMGVCPQGKARPTGPDTEITDALCMLTCTQASSTKGESGSLLRCDPRDPTGRAPASAVGGTCAPALGQPGWAVVLTGLTGLKTVGISSTATVDKGVTGLRAP